MNTKRLVMSFGMLAFVGAVVVGGTGAFFSDTETSTGNVFTAGSVSIDLQDVIHDYGGDDNNAPVFEWFGGQGRFDLDDLKPLDTGNLAINLENGANEAYVCAMIDGTPGAGLDAASGALYDQLNFFQADGTQVVPGTWFDLGTAAPGGPVNTGVDYCFGDANVDGTGLVSCDYGDGSIAYNDAQGGQFSADLMFYAIQTRNNDGFTCDQLEVIEGEPVYTPSEEPSATETYSTGFEPTAFAVGDINGQDGWQKAGASLDSEVVNDPVISDTQSLRISNAVTTGNFGDQTFTPQLSAAAGETGVAPENRFEAEFEISSTMLAEQPGLAISVSPDNGSGARMSYLGFADSAAGIDVTFFDVANAGPLPTVSTFNPTSLGSLDRNTSHTIKFVIDFVDGPGNDVVQIYINGALAHTGTSWEDHFRYDPEQSGNGGQILYPVNSLIFRAAGTAVPATDGDGYLFDNVVLTSSTI